MPETTRVVVLFGGRNTEHAVSVKSATSVIRSLDRTRYAVTPIRITVEGRWVVGGEAPADLADEAALERLTAEVDAPATAAESLAAALDVIRLADVVFPVLHGPYGEDGTVQSILEHLGVPYVGSGVLASAVGMDKEFTKKVLSAEGIAVADGVSLRAGDDVPPADRQRLGLPVFVKPARGGSSIGVSHVHDWDDLPAAVATARHSDPRVLVEAAVPGREVDVGVLETPDGRLLAGPPLEIRVADDHGFFDYQAKYQRGITDFVVPADLDPAVTERLQETAVRVFRALECSGMLRVDFFVAEDGGLTVNEVNTIPGLTSMSQFPRMWQAAGVSYPDLLDQLIRTALRPAARVAVTAS